MTVAEKKLHKTVVVIATLLLIVAFIHLSRNYWGLHMGPNVEENKLQKELQLRKYIEEQKTRDRFSSLDEFENVMNYEALIGAETEDPIFNETAESNSAVNEPSTYPLQKKHEFEADKLDGKRSNEESISTSYDGYTVQIAALSNPQAAEEMASQLREEGFTAYVEQTDGKNGKALFRIRVGKYDVRDDAEKTLKELVETGRTGFVVRQ